MPISTTLVNTHLRQSHLPPSLCTFPHWKPSRQMSVAPRRYSRSLRRISSSCSPSGTRSLLTQPRTRVIRAGFMCLVPWTWSSQCTDRPPNDGDPVVVLLSSSGQRYRPTVESVDSTGLALGLGTAPVNIYCALKKQFYGKLSFIINIGLQHDAAPTLRQLLDLQPLVTSVRQLTYTEDLFLSALTDIHSTKWRFPLLVCNLAEWSYGQYFIWNKKIGYIDRIQDRFVFYSLMNKHIIRGLLSTIKWSHVHNETRW